MLNKKFRIAQKNLERDLNQFQSCANELETQLDQKQTAGSISRLLGGVVEKLQAMKRKAEESIGEELEAGYVCKRRLDHLKASIQNDNDESIEPELRLAATNQFKKIRMDRMLVEHFMRLGYYETAELLATRSGIRMLTNVDIFKTLGEIERDLKNRSTTKCIAWCMENKTKLKKINSTLEFQLRVQEFVELIRQDQRFNAVRHAQKYFPAFEQEQLKEIREVMGLLAYQVTTEIEKYKKFFDEKRWDQLILDFRLENYRLFQLPTQSVLTEVMQAGISALKTPQCYSEISKNVNCPVCHLNINEIADALPFAHCAQSRLICRVTGKPMNEHNPPLMLPNGQVYGTSAIERLLKDDGTLTCPRTQEKFVNPKIEKVFIM